MSPLRAYLSRPAATLRANNLRMTPVETFFLAVLPTAIAADTSRFQSLSGRLSFKCGKEAFVVDLGNVAVPVTAGFDRTADVRLWFFNDAFERFVSGVPVIGKKDRIVEGNATVLERFGRFLRPAPVQNPLLVRLGVGSEPVNRAKNKVQP